jgi:DNA-binding HxlR family transcriptional regulator
LPSSGICRSAENASPRFAISWTGVTEKVLTEQLRQLEKDGVVMRLVTHSVPPRVDYELTVAGNDLVPVMQAMCDWGYLGVIPTLPRRMPVSA